MFKIISITILLLPILIILINNNPADKILAAEYIVERPFLYPDPKNHTSEKFYGDSNFKEYKNNEMIKNNLLTYYDQTMNLKIDYPDYWEIYTVGNDTLAIIPPLNFSGMLIKILDSPNLDKFIYERITLQKKTLENFHLIYTYDIPYLNDKESKKSVIMYLANDGSGFLKAVEIMFNYENKNTYHISFVSNSTIFDTLAPAVNQILNSITILTSENDDRFDVGLGEESKNTEIKLSSQSDSISTKSSDYDTMSKSSEINSILSIAAGAATPRNPAYAPDPLRVTKGDVITVTNDDTAPHTVTNGASPGDADAGTLFDTSIMMAGDTAQIDTSSLEAGDYAYYCHVHPFMTGTLTVQ